MALTLPSDFIITQDDLDFGALAQVLPGNHAYFCAGNLLADLQSMISNAMTLKTAVKDDEIFLALGELAEKPGKVDSKSEKLKTRNYLIPGRRSSSVELSFCGLSAKQKDYFESALFQGLPITLLITDKEVETIDPELDEVSLVALVGLSWTVDWSGEADGLWTVVISTELQGETENLIFPVNVPIYEEEE